MSHLATAPTAPADEREIYVSGLRALADFLEQHPDVPVEDHGTINHYFGFGVSRDEFVTAANALGGAVSIDDWNYVVAERSFGAIKYALRAPASGICEEREEMTKVTVLPDALRGRQAA